MIRKNKLTEIGGVFLSVKSAVAAQSSVPASASLETLIRVSIVATLMSCTREACAVQGRILHFKLPFLSIRYLFVE